MGKTKKPIFVLLAIVIISLIVFIQTLPKVDQKPVKPEQQEETPSDTPTSPPPQEETNSLERKERPEVDLEIDLAPVVTSFPNTGRILYGYWFRDENDLPIFNYGINIYVTNHGKKIVENVNITVTDRKQIIYNEIKKFGPGYSYIKLIENITIQYNTHTLLYLTVYCKENNPPILKKLISISPPWFRTTEKIDNKIALFYITPQNPEIQTLFSEMNVSENNWLTIADWINYNIDYNNEQPSIWQLSHETLLNQKGNSIDKSILLCTLLRTCGFSKDEVYIALSKQNDEQAATLIKLNNSSWGKIIYEETDYTMLIIESMDEIKEDMDIAFNDVEYITLT
jgi:hypothetical protein